jgi:hypothetical protein
MTMRRFPVFMRQALEALSRDAGHSMEQTVGALLELGMPLLRRFPGVTECQDARQALLLRANDSNVRLWLEQKVGLDLRAAGLGVDRFVIRVLVSRHRQIGQIAGALGFHQGECFTLALTAASIGSSYVPMESANVAMYQTLIDLRSHCAARAEHAMTLLHQSPQQLPKPRWNIHDVLGG